MSIDTRVRIFYSYSHKDEFIKNKIQTALSSLKKEGLTIDLHDRKIMAGEQFDDKIMHYIDIADIILILVSPDYIESDYCYDIELRRAIDRAHLKLTHIVPIVIRETDWRNTLFSSFLALPTDGKALKSWRNTDAALLNIAAGVRAIAISILKKKKMLSILPQWNIDTQGSPFPGLTAFTDKHRKVFFGRSAQIKMVINKLSQSPFIFIIGSSGVGKSSLIWAGVIPSIISGTIEEAQKNMPAIRLTPSQAEGDPIRGLADALTIFPPSAAHGCSSHYIENLLLGGVAKYEALEKFIFGNRPKEAKILIFIDQFEEIFTCSKPEHVKLFIEWLVAFLEGARSFLLLTMRTEFLEQCMESKALEPLQAWIEEGLFPLMPPNSLAFSEMIVYPSSMAGIDVDNNVLDQIVKDMGENPGGLPLMAFVLERIFFNGACRNIQISDYEAVGRINGAIQHQVQHVISSIVEETLGVSKHEIISLMLQVFGALVDVDEKSGSPIRKKVSIDSFKTKSLQYKIIQKLIDSRLLVTDEDHIYTKNLNAKKITLEVAHEALFRSWPDLASWIDSKKSNFLLRKKLQRDALEWHENGRPDSHSWSNERCLEAGKMLESLDYIPSKYESEFLGPVTIGEMLSAISSKSTTHQERATIGIRLAILGDPRHGIGIVNGKPDIWWCPIQPGTVSIKTNSDKKIFEVSCFEISKYPITQSQYRVFLEDVDGYKNPAWWINLPDRAVIEPGRQIPYFDNHPAVNVDWSEAVAYCRWLSKSTGFLIRLPTEAEWQLAGTINLGSSCFPWGDKWLPNNANTYDSNLNRTIAVGMYAHTAFTDNTPLDMCGNVWEWCLDDFDDPTIESMINYKSLAEKVRKGGSWDDSTELSKSTSRFYRHPHMRYSDIGFRVVRIQSGS